MKALLLMVASAFLFSCAAEQDKGVVWVTQDAWLEPVIFAAQSYLIGQGEDVSQNRPGKDTNTAILFDPSHPRLGTAFSRWNLDGSQQNTITIGGIFAKLTDGVQAVVMAHEIKHLLGYGHSTRCGDLMSEFLHCQPESLD